LAQLSRTTTMLTWLSRMKNCSSTRERYPQNKGVFQKDHFAVWLCVLYQAITTSCGSLAPPQPGETVATHRGYAVQFRAFNSQRSQWQVHPAHLVLRHPLACISSTVCSSSARAMCIANTSTRRELRLGAGSDRRSPNNLLPATHHHSHRTKTRVSRTGTLHPHILVES